ncbi:MAG: hypothetical protein M1828_006636 [Chrysothrix sp. TS-e1954]|nr:MAG: hypothetical protein M1828_006636 [Chrysothrix sp. TS-e1954]
MESKEKRPRPRDDVDGGDRSLSQKGDLDRSIERMRAKMATQPLVMRIDSKNYYRLDETALKLSLRDTPFDIRESHLQYTTYKERGSVDKDCLLQYEPLSEPHSKASGVDQRALLGLQNGNNTPSTNTGPRKKINLSDYQKRKKLSVNDVTSSGNTPSDKNSNAEQVKSNVAAPGQEAPAVHKEALPDKAAVSEARRSPDEKSIKIEKGSSHARTAEGILANDTKSALQTNDVTTLAKSDTTSKHHGTESKEEPSAVRDEKPPVQNTKEVTHPDQKHLEAPPWLPDSFHDGEVHLPDPSTLSSSQSPFRALSSPTSFRGTTATSQTSAGSGLSLHLPIDEAFDKADEYARLHANDTRPNPHAQANITANEQQEAPDETEKKAPEPQKVIKLAYGKRNFSEVSKILRRGSSTKTETPKSKSQASQTSSANRTTLSGVQGTKHAREAGDVESGQPDAKRLKQKPGQDTRPVQNPRTPEKSARDNALLDTPSSSSKHSVQSGSKQDLLATPVKHLKQSEAAAATPQGPAFTPAASQNGKLTPEPPRSNATTSAQQWKAEYSRLTKLATTLKRQAQSNATQVNNAKTERATSDQAKLAAVEAVASLMYFMTALCALDQSQRSWSGWWDLRNISNYIAGICQPFPHLHGLVLALKSIIFTRVVNVGANCIKADDGKGIAALLEASRLMEESATQAEQYLSRKILADHYPSAYKLSGAQPLGILAKPMTAVRMGWKLLDEWAAKNQLKEWTQKLEEGACGQL